MRDLEHHVDLSRIPKDPEAIIRQRARQIRANRELPSTQRAQISNVIERDYQLKRAMGFSEETFTRMDEMIAEK